MGLVGLFECPSNGNLIVDFIGVLLKRTISQWSKRNVTFTF